MLDDIQEFKRNTIIGLEKVQRWEQYVKLGATKENDLQNSFSKVILTIIVLEILKKEPPTINYDPYSILACAALHDFGEIGIGDTIYKNKTETTTKLEAESYILQINRFPKYMRDDLLNLYLLQYSSADQSGNTIIFELVERTGYIFYAIGEYKKSKENIFMLVQVLRNQLEYIKRLLIIMPGCRQIFNDKIMTRFDEILTQYDGQFVEN